MSSFAEIIGYLYEDDIFDENSSVNYTEYYDYADYDVVNDKDNVDVLDDYSFSINHFKYLILSMHI